MKQKEILHIEYTKATDLGGRKGEVTQRDVIPTFIPTGNIKAIDVTQLTEAEQKNLLNWFREYTEYYETFVKQAFTFEDWLAHTHGGEDVPEIKWRTFKQDNMTILE